jgi:gliding motility-associated-like protein
MKKLFFIISFLFSVSMFSQFVTVAPSTALQMAQGITNPRCITITGTPIIKSGSDFAGNPNSVGTFSAGAGSTFPIANGIVLSTGSLNKVSGPKDLPNYAGDGNTAWPGDADMNSHLGQSNFVNASSLEFNFTSLKTNFKFNFLFSSEEYGNNQCLAIADDVMVILLTDLVSGITTNIASTPSIISPNNIRKMVNNPGCPDSNPTFFGTIYNNSSGPSAPINFLGSTVAMTASSSNLIVGHPYKLKIVVADRITAGYDSAVFISNYKDVIVSANLLGPDQTLCEGTATTLTANIPAGTSIASLKWKKDGALLGETTTSLNISTADAVGNHTYSFSYLVSTCGPFDGQSDSIILDYLPPTVTPNPITLYKCSASTSYNLDENTAILSNGLGFTPVITYHTDAACATSALPIIYSGTATTLYVKIAKPGTTACAIIKSFSLSTITDPVATTPGTQTLCARAINSNGALFTLSDLDLDVLNGQSNLIYGVSYHLTAPGATNNTNLVSINSVGSSIISAGTIFVRVYVIGSQSCFATTSFNVVVNPLLAADKIDEVIYCDNQYILPPLTNGRYFTNKYIIGLPNSQLPELFAGDIIPSTSANTNSTTIYVSNLVTLANPCTQEFPLKITFVKPTIFKVTPDKYCDKYVLPSLQYGDYYNASGGPTGGGSIITEVTATTDVYYYFQSSINTTQNPSCTVVNGPANIIIQNKPDLGPDRPNIFTCSPPYVLPTLASQGYPNAKYYNGPGGTGGEITNLSITATTPTTKDIYIYQEDTQSLRCPAEKTFKIFIGLANPGFPSNSCDLVLPDLSPAQYWTQPGGTGQRYYAGQHIPSGTYYLYVPYVGPPCTSPFTNEVSFTVTVSQPLADNLNYQAFKIDGSTENLTATEVSIVNPETLSCGTIKLLPIANGKYYTESNRNGGTGGTQLFANDIIPVSATTTSIFVYSKPLPGLTCDNEREFRFKILEKPVLVPINTFLEPCTDTPFTLPILGPGEAYYTEKKGVVNRQLFTATSIQGPSTTILQIYKENPTDPSCYTETEFKIIINPEVIIPTPTNAIEEHCTNFTLPPPSIVGSFYYDYSNLPLLTDPFGTELTNLNIALPTGTSVPYFDKTFYIYKGIFDGTRKTPCQDEEKIRVLLYKQPSITAIPDQYFCGSTPITGADLPAITGTNLVVPTDIATAAKYYTGAGGTGVEITPTTVLTNGQMVYAYAKNPSIVPGSTFAGCADEKSFKVNIFKVDAITGPIKGCGSIALSDLPVLTVGNYFTSPNGVNPLTASDLVNSGTTLLIKTIYVYGSSSFPAGKCQNDQTQFNVEITPIPVTNTVPLLDANPLNVVRTFCDDYQDNDGVYLIQNLNIFDTLIKGSQTGTEFSVTYHSTEPDALLATNNNPITSTTLNTVYAVVRNSNFPNCSSIPYKLDFIIKLRPIPTPTDKYLCVDNITYLPALGDTVILDTNLPLTGNTFVWYDTAGAIMPAETGSTLIAGNTGTFSVIVTGSNGCASDKTPVKVIPSSKAITTYTVTQNFEDNQTIVVIATGASGSIYEYQLDGDPFQDSNVFENLYDGEHTIVVRDKNGCGDSDPILALIINYPKFFTPNGDGIHDAWNIKGLKEQQNAKITIYDRHGKLIKQISPKGEGWDGRYNGSELPSSDYWFTVRYLEGGITKEFKSHFSMKR